MPWPTYSERILHHSAQGVWRYTVPAKMRLVITAIDLVNAQGVAGADFSLRTGPILVAYFAFQAAWRTENLALRSVVYQGEVVELNISHNGINVTVSGFVFQDESGRTGPPLSAATKPDVPELPRPGEVK